jgi:hypothetical protein
VAESVVALFFGRTRVVHDHQPGCFQLGVIVGREGAGQSVPAVCRVANAELLGDLPGQAATLKVGHRGLALPELLPVVGRCLGHQVGEGGGFLAPLRLRLALFLGAVVVGYRHAHLLSQFLDCLYEPEPNELIQKSHRVTVHATAEAMVRLPRGADDETGGLLAVERAQPLVVDAGFLELHVAGHHFDDVDSGQEVLYEATGNHAPSLAGGHCPGAPSMRNGPDWGRFRRAPGGVSDGKVRQ